MKAKEELSVTCPVCGLKVNDIDDIIKLFGFHYVEGELTHNQICKRCYERIQEESEKEIAPANLNSRWASAARWGRQINISGSVFNSYLIDMGYLKYGVEDGSKKGKLIATELGQKHSATVNVPFSKKLLWDEETYFVVINERLKKGFIHDVCPKCKAYLDTMPNYDRMSSTHECCRCGNICSYWEVKGVYDR